MNGDLLSVWSRTWKEVWSPLAKHAPSDLFIELVAAVAVAPSPPVAPTTPPAEAYDEQGELIDVTAIQARSEYDIAMLAYSEAGRIYQAALNSESDARVYFQRLLKSVSSEGEAIHFLEKSHGALSAYGDSRLTSRFRELAGNFLFCFSLRYELRGEFSIHATIPGLFTKLIVELRRVALADPHLANLLSEFEEAFADLKMNRTQARMKTCLQKQFNMLEALGRMCPHVTATTLGAICDQLDWPHEKIKEVGKNLYRFGSDYPGLRHGGTPAGALRALEMKDFVSLSLMLASFTPYVAHSLDSERCYGA